MAQGMFEKYHCPTCNSIEFKKYGFSKPVQSFRGLLRQRFRCLECGKCFCENTLKFSFRLKKKDPALNSKIFLNFIYGLSNRQIAEVHGVSECCVRIRLDRMAKQALIYQYQSTKDLKIFEAIGYDGLENFAYSQYDPNNIQHAIGSESLFIYDFNFAPLNRKGWMSHWQRRRLDEIQQKYGRYDPRAIRKQTKHIFNRLYTKRAHEDFEIHSDEHFQYRRVVEKDLRELKIKHKKISSKACRNFQNILFGVNHSDLLARHRLANMKRETISFSKTAGRMCQKYALFMIHKNYMRPQFSKKHVRRPVAHQESPAQNLKIINRILKFGDIFDKYPTKNVTRNFPQDWQCFFDAQVPQECQRNLKFSKKAA